MDIALIISRFQAVYLSPVVNVTPRAGTGNRADAGPDAFLRVSPG